MTERRPLADALLFPLRGGSLWVLLICPLLIALATNAGLLGLWLLIVVGYMLTAYGFQLLDAVADGRSDPPVMSGSVHNPLNEGRPLVVLVLVLAAGGVVSAVAHATSDAVAGLVAAVLLAFLPAAIAVLGLRRGTFWAFNPLALVATAVRLGPQYLVCLGALAVFAVLHPVVDELPLLSPVVIFIQMYAAFAVFCVIGGAIHVRRHEVGHEPVRSAERSASRDARDGQAAMDGLTDEAYRLTRAEKYKEAYDAVAGRLAELRTDPAGQLAVFNAIASWDDGWLAVRVAPELVSTLLKANRGLEALAVSERAFSLDEDFRPTHAGETLRIAREAARAGRKPLARAFLQDFDTRYPDAPARSLADQLRRDLAAEPL